MLNPQSVHLLIKHFDAIDQAVSKRMIRKRPWSEPALTSFLCELLDEETQDEVQLAYRLKARKRYLRLHAWPRIAPRTFAKGFLFGGRSVCHKF